MQKLELLIQYTVMLKYPNYRESMYLLTKWEGRMEKKLARGPCTVLP